MTRTWCVENDFENYAFFYPHTAILKSAVIFVTFDDGLCGTV
jgi:hypothetical protein